MGGDRVPRIRPLRTDELDQDQREYLERTITNAGGEVTTRSKDEPVGNFMATMVRHLPLFRRWGALGATLLMKGTLQPRDRELACLRTAWLCEAPFEWGQHVAIAHKAGIGPQEVERVTQGPDAPGWDPRDQAILRGVDELHNRADISDNTWRGLRAHFDERQLIELLVLVGNYHTVAFVQNSLRIDLEAGAGDLTAR